MCGPHYARLWSSRYPLLVPVLIFHCLDIQTIRGKRITISPVAIYFSVVMR
jgi:hypothetical protein